MPKHKYIPSPTNLFEGSYEEDDDDDAQVFNSFRPRIPFQQKPTSSYGVHDRESESHQQLILEKRRKIEQRTLDSSSRSLRVLHDSEKMGITAAEELVCQHETLAKVNKKLEEMNPKLNSSQKHLNGINSIFYSLRSYFSSKSDPELSRHNESNSIRIASPTSKRLNRTLETLSQKSESNVNYNSHPSTRLRDFDEQVLTGPITDSQRVDETLETNLNDMGQVISRLKDLGLALGEEINEQNELLNIIGDKVEETSIQIGNQNKQINKLLGK